MDGKWLRTIIAAVVLLLRGGDCVSPLFATPAESDCCARGHCGPSENADSCCKSADPSNPEQFPVEGKISVPNLTTLPAPGAQAAVMPIQNVLAQGWDYSQFHSPPNGFERVSSPLLI